MASVTRQRAGRKWTVDSTGIKSLEREYVVVRDDILGGDAEAVSFAGVPKIGSAHPNHPGLFVQGYDVREGESSDKKTIVVAVKYSTIDIETIAQEQGEVSAQVEEWGWDDGTDEKELTCDTTGKAVLNSAGDPFESVPKVSTPAPVFTKTMKFTSRQSGWSSCNCKTNAEALTIGSQSCEKGTLLCTVAERRVIGDAYWKYQYTVKLRYKTNKVAVNGKESATEIGWDVAVADAGMREKSGDKKVLIRSIDAETGKVCQVASATLLDGAGKKAEEGATPYYFRFAAYESASFPAWFYSEPV